MLQTETSTEPCIFNKLRLRKMSIIGKIFMYHKSDWFWSKIHFRRWIILNLLSDIFETAFNQMSMNWPQSGCHFFEVSENNCNDVFWWISDISDFDTYDFASANFEFRNSISFALVINNESFVGWSLWNRYPGRPRRSERGLENLGWPDQN